MQKCDTASEKLAKDVDLHTKQSNNDSRETLLFPKFPMSVSENSAEHELQINSTCFSYPDNLSAIRVKHTCNLVQRASL